MSVKPTILFIPCAILLSACSSVSNSGDLANTSELVQGPEKVIIGPKGADHSILFELKSEMFTDKEFLIHITELNKKIEFDLCPNYEEVNCASHVFVRQTGENEVWINYSVNSLQAVRKEKVDSQVIDLPYHQHYSISGSFFEIGKRKANIKRNDGKDALFVTFR